MAPATRIRGIKPAASFQQNGERIIEVRLKELLSWRDAVADPSRSTDLHNMRIAAKRLRYALEIFELCFPEVKPALKDLSEIQESLGAIHDLDVLAEMLRQRLRALDLRVQEGAVAAARQADSAGDHVAAVLDGAARDPQRLGLIGLLAEKIGERQTQYEAFILRWHGPGLDRLAETIRDALTEPATSE
jgi:hypothetical protein